MTLLTIFTAPKPFTDPHIDVIQRNAIQSWVHLGAQVEVVLIGNEAGIAEVAQEYQIKHLPDVARNTLGTPLVNSVFELARSVNDSPLLLYANADILLLPETVALARQVMRQLDHFLLVGQRWDLDVREPLDFSEGWPARLRAEVKARGKLHRPEGSDYFIFPRNLYKDIPEFAIGRAGWDNWMIYHAVTQPWPAVDASQALMAVHQNHDYSHLPGGQPHYKLPETYRNAELLGGFKNVYILLDVNKELIEGRIRRPRFGLARLLRRIERWLQPLGEPAGGLRWFLTARLRRWRIRLVDSRG